MSNKLRTRRVEDAVRRARVAGRGERFDGTYHMIQDDMGKTVFGLQDIEESADVRVIRVILHDHQDWIIPPCPSSSPGVLDNPNEVNMRVECDEDKTLFDLLYAVRDGQRLLDRLEAKLDHWMERPSDLARLVDIHFSRLGPR